MNKPLTGFTVFKRLKEWACMVVGKGAVLCALLCCALLSCCTSSDSGDFSAGGGSTLHVVSASSPVEVTRSVSELTSGSIGVFQTSTSDGYTLQANKEYAYAAGTWGAVGEDIRLHSADALICAYAPYAVSLSDYTAVSLTSGAYDTATDLSYSTTLAGPVNTLNREVSFTLDHAYARVTLNIRRGSYQGTGAISSITLSGDGLYSSGTLNLSTGVYSGQVAGAVTLTPGIASTATDSDTPVYFRLVPASTLSSGLTLTFVVDGYTLTASTTTYTGLEAGVNYQASVVINGQEVTPTDVETDEWEEVPYDDVIYTGI